MVPSLESLEFDLDLARSDLKLASSNLDDLREDILRQKAKNRALRVHRQYLREAPVTLLSEWTSVLEAIRAGVDALTRLEHQEYGHRAALEQKRLEVRALEASLQAARIQVESRGQLLEFPHERIRRREVPNSD